MFAHKNCLEPIFENLYDEEKEVRMVDENYDLSPLST